MSRISIEVLIVVALVSAPAAAQLISPTAVPGKEYSDHRDVDQSKVADDLQNLFWDGFGNNLDAFDYSTSGPPPLDPDQVDALANEQDYLFQNMLNNTATMIVSLDTENFLRYRTPTGVANIWATGLQIRGANNNGPPTEVDAVELWGGPGSPPQHDGSGSFDANHYSYIGDAVIPVPPGNVPAISIFHYDPNTNVSKSYIDHDPLRNQLNLSFGWSLESIDVDALMVDDIAGDTLWGTGDTIIFSLRPVNAGPIFLDGGELFVWQNGLPIQYLVHGGITWDTLNPVGLLFNSNSENIDALEGIIPEPNAAILILAGMAMVGCRRRS